MTLRIQWDTNVFVRALVTGSPTLEAFLDFLYDMHINGLIEFINPKAVQSEFYAILAAGRVKVRRSDGNQVKRPFSHAEILQFTSIYPALFDSDFIESLGAWDWKPNQGKAYKTTWQALLDKEYGWNDFGKSFIEKKLKNTVQALGIEGDIYDWPIMASALLFETNLLATANMGDFRDPLGLVRVMDVYETVEFLKDL